MVSERRPERPAVIAALPTPFASDGGLDLEAWRDLCDAIAASGVDGVFVGGTTGEFVALAPDERRALVEVALERCAGIEVYPHVGAASAWEAARLAEHAARSGATRMAAVTPYYFRASSPELNLYYREVAAAGSIDLFGYSIPALAGNAIDAALLGRLLAIPNFRGVKVSLQDADAVRELICAAAGRGHVYVGNDRLAAEGLRTGATGLVSGPAAAVPEPYLALAGALADGDQPRAERARRLIDLVASETGGGDVALIKLALEVRGLPGGRTRVPFPAPSIEDARRLEKVLECVSVELGASL